MNLWAVRENTCKGPFDRFSQILLRVGCAGFYPPATLEPACGLLAFPLCDLSSRCALCSSVRLSGRVRRIPGTSVRLQTSPLSSWTVILLTWSGSSSANGSRSLSCTFQTSLPGYCLLTLCQVSSVSRKKTVLVVFC